MNPRNLLVAVAAVLVLGAAFTLRSQGLTDGIKVTLPQPVTVGDVVLEPGEYEIRRASMNQDQVLRIFSNDKLRWQTNVITIAALSKDTPEDSKVILHHIGDSYYFDKIWMEGKDYGYEFPLPDKARALQKELAVSVPARYEAVRQTSVESTPDNSSQVAVAVDQARDQDKERADTEALAREQRDAAARAERDRQAQLDQIAREAELERNRVAALQREEQTPVTQSPAAARSESTSVGIQDNAAQDNQQELPATASSWFSYMLGGCLLLAMGGFFRKTRTQE